MTESISGSGHVFLDLNFLALGTLRLISRDLCKKVQTGNKETLIERIANSLM